MVWKLLKSSIYKMNAFKNPLDPDNLKAKDLLKKWLSTKLKLEATAHIDIIEYQCADQSCLHAETVFHVFETPNTEGWSRIYKIAKPLVFIRRWDIDAITESIESKNLVHKH